MNPEEMKIAKLKKRGDITNDYILEKLEKYLTNEKHT